MPSLTAWQGLFVHGRLGSGQRVIVPAYERTMALGKRGKVVLRVIG
jgi:hypothetical protein